MNMWSAEEEEGFSFIHSVPYTFSAHNGDGPNRVEIFDIISLPSHHRAISETTCLCDIFGDGCESPARSCSPASGMLSTAEVDDFTLADDTNNDSSGSYHTAVCSEELSDSSETFQDSKDTPSPTPSETVSSSNSTCVAQSSESNYFPPQPTDPTLLPDVRVINLSCPLVSYQSRPIVLPPEMSATPIMENRYTNNSPKHQLPVHSLISSTTSPSPSDGTTSPLPEPRTLSPKPGYKYTLPKPIISSSPRVQAMAPTPKSRITCYSSTPPATSPTLEPGICFPSSKSMCASSSLKVQTTSHLPKPRTTCQSIIPQATSPVPIPQVRTPSPKSGSTAHSPIPQNTSPSLRTQVIPSSSNPGSIYNSPIPQATSPSPKPQAMTPSSKPETTCYSPIHQATPLSPRPQTMTPLKPGNTCPSSIPQATAPSPRPQAVTPSPKPENTCPSPIPQTTAPSPRPQAVTPSPKPGSTCPSPIPQTTAPSPTAQAVTPSPNPGNTCPSPIPQTTAPSPTAQAVTPSPKPGNTCPSPIPQTTAPSPTAQAVTPSPKPGNTCHSPKPQPTSPSPKPQVMTPSSKPETTCYSPISQATSPSPRPQAMTPIKPGSTCPSSIPQTTAPSLRPQGISPSPKPETTCQSPTPQDSSPSHRPLTMSLSSKCETTCQSPKPQAVSPLPNPHVTFPLPTAENVSPLPKPRKATSSSITQATTPSPQTSSPSFNLGTVSQSSELHTLSPSPKLQAICPTTKPRSFPPSYGYISPTPKPQSTSPLPKLENTTPLCEPESTSLSLILNTSSPKPVITSHSDKTEAITSTSKFKDASPLAETEEKTSSPISSLTTGMSTQLEDNMNSTNFLFEPENVNFFSKYRTTSSSPRCQGMDLATQPKIAGYISAYSDSSPTLEPNEVNISSCPEATGQIPSLKSCEIDVRSMAEAADNGNQRERFCSSQLQFTSDKVPIIASGNQENVQKGAEKCNVHPGHEADVSPKPANVSQKPHKVIVSSRESPCIDKYSNNQQRDREGGVGDDSRGEDQWGKKGEEKQGEAGYREEQVQLSFTARNRKLPVSRSPPTTDRQPQSGTPARCYSECLSTQRQRQHQHQNSVRPQRTQHEQRGCAKKPQPPPETTSGSVPDCDSVNSSMGSELDETDNEVKWFTDLAFESLSSPQVDYLDMYNSSHRSSTNVSQPSTEDSAGANAWSAYADLRGSARHENDELSRHPPAALPSEGLNRAKRFDMGSFECVDVALESREEVRRGKRTVPKRQIQLKRRDSSESQTSANSEVAEATSICRNSKDIFLRQHSTPAAMQEDFYRSESDSIPGDRKQKLQKSASLDETSGKTKMASCLIKSVLSKKMQDEDKLASQQMPVKKGGTDTTQVMNRPSEGPLSPFIKQTTKTEVSSLSSGLASDCSLSSEDLLSRAEPTLPDNSNKECDRFSSNPHQKGPCKSSGSPFQRSPAMSESQNNSTVRLDTRTEVPITFESNKKNKQFPAEERKQLVSSSLGEENSSDSASAIIGNTSVTASHVLIEQSGRTNRSPESLLKPENHKQQNIRQLFKSRTPEIMLKSCTAGETRQATVKVSDPEIISEKYPAEHRSEDPEKGKNLDKKSEDEKENLIDNETNKTKGPIHKVRDVRKVVKNTYNLSFRAASAPSEDRVSPCQKKKQALAPVPLQIEFKAISRKEEKTETSGGKGDKEVRSPPSQASQEAIGGTSSFGITPKSITTKDMASSESHDTGVSESHDTNVSESRDKIPGSETVKVDTLDVCKSPMLVKEKQKEIKTTPELSTTPKPPKKDREISTLILLQDGQTNDGKDPSAPPPLSLTTTSSSRSVSMLLKEKGFQADIGFCDTLNGNQKAVPKHVNRLEVPLQMCAVEETGTGSQKGKFLDPVPSRAATISPKPTPPSDAKRDLNQKDSPTPSHVDLEKISLRCPERETNSDVCNAQETTVSATSSYTQQESFTEETHSTSFIQKSTDLPTSDSSEQPVVTVTSSITPNSVPTSNLEQSKIVSAQEQVMSGGSSRTKQPVPPTAVETPNYAVEPAAGPSSRHQTHPDRLRFYASDEPPSYDERESFSPLLLTDLPARRYHRYHPTCHIPPCSCTAEGLLSPSHSSLQPPNLTPPSLVPVRAPEPPYTTAVPSSSQCETRLDVQSVSCQAGLLPPTQARTSQVPSQTQHLTAMPGCPAPLPRPRSEESRPPPPGQRMDRPAARHRSPQHPTQLVAASPYASRTHSPSISSLEARPQYLCSPQGFTSPFGPEYSAEGSGGSGMLYPESSGGLYGQSPRRVLLDPETGKYFYIEVPMQPLRKMLFDPETGHYVEVLIPQSGLYPPSAVPYPSLHSPSMYAPQYMPYSLPPHPPSQQPRHPQSPATASLHQNSTGFASPGTRGSKAEPQNHPPLDQSYLESMYYIPTGMTASPNPTPPDLYHKPPSSLPNTG